VTQEKNNSGEKNSGEIDFEFKTGFKVSRQFLQKFFQLSVFVYLSP